MALALGSSHRKAICWLLLFCFSFPSSRVRNHCCVLAKCSIQCLQDLLLLLHRFRVVAIAAVPFRRNDVSLSSLSPSLLLSSHSVYTVPLCPCMQSFRHFFCMFFVRIFSRFSPVILAFSIIYDVIFAVMSCACKLVLSFFACCSLSLSLSLCRLFMCALSIFLFFFSIFCVFCCCSCCVVSRLRFCPHV